MADPVIANATLDVQWGDLRRTCTITATATGAPNMRVEAGYARNSYRLGSKLTAGATGTLVISDLNHGSGQKLYIHAIPEAADGTQYGQPEIFRTVPIPNPILGVTIPSCGDGEAGATQKYIVDIVEHKANNTCTPRWQNGDRVVINDPCSDSSTVDPSPTCRMYSMTNFSFGSNSVFTSILPDSNGNLVFTYNPAVEGSTYRVANLGLTSLYFLYSPHAFERSGRCYKAGIDFPDYTPGVQYDVWLECTGDPGNMWFRFSIDEDATVRQEWALPTTGQKTRITMPAGNPNEWILTCMNMATGGIINAPTSLTAGHASFTLKLHIDPVTS